MAYLVEKSWIICMNMVLHFEKEDYNVGGAVAFIQGVEANARPGR
jgi:hypothetical protein